MLCNWFLEVHCSSGCWWVFGFNCGSNRLSPLEAAGNINLSPFSCSRVHTDRQLSPGHDACYCQLCRESALGVLSSVTFSCKPSERFAGITFNFWQLATISKANDCGFGWQKIPLFVVSFLKSLIQRDIYIYISLFKMGEICRKLLTAQLHTLWNFTVLRNYWVHIRSTGGRDSSVGIATRYGLDGPGIESRWGGGRDFPHLPRAALGPTQPPVQWAPGLSTGVKRPGRGVDHPPQLAPRLKEE